MQYNFDDMPDRRNTESAKWNYFDKDVLPLWVADMDFVSPEPVVRALHERIAHGVFGYGLKVPGLCETIVERMQRLYNWKISTEDIAFVPGVVTGINLAARAFVRSGQGVLTQTPVYTPFLNVARMAGGINQEAALDQTPDGSYIIDWDVLEQSIDERTSMFLLCSPHNPVGRVWTRPELERIAEICSRHDLIICSDEIHCDLVYSDHDHLPIASLDPDISRRTVTLMAPSKTFNIAGLSCSFAIIQDPDLRMKYVKADQGLVHGVNILGLIAAKAAYQEGQEWLDQLLEYLDGNRRFLDDFVRQNIPGVKMIMPEGTYLAWLDFRQVGLGDKPAQFFLKNARVALSEGDVFGKNGTGFVRLNFGCPRAILEEALERMKSALE